RYFMGSPPGSAVNLVQTKRAVRFSVPLQIGVVTAFVLREGVSSHTLLAAWWPHIRLGHKRSQAQESVFVRRIRKTKSRRWSRRPRDRAQIRQATIYHSASMVSILAWLGICSNNLSAWGIPSFLASVR